MKITDFNWLGCNKVEPHLHSEIVFVFSNKPGGCKRYHCCFEGSKAHLCRESGLQFIQEAELTSNGKSHYSHSRHVWPHMLEKHTPSTGRISSNTTLALEFHMYAHTHTYVSSIQSKGSAIIGWDWAWNRLILFTCPEPGPSDTHTQTPR